VRGAARILVLGMSPIGVLLYAAELSGRVVDVTGGPIHNTTIELRRVGNSALITSFVTSLSGVFRFVDLSADTYEISLTAAGFAVRRATRTVAEGERASVGDIILQLAPIESCPDEWGPPAIRLMPLNSGTEVTGSVEERGRPLPRVAVVLENPNHTYRTATSAIGAFRFGGIETGDYSLRVVQPGFAEFVIDVLRIRDRQRTEIADPLQPSRCPENVKCKPIREIQKVQICL
jgi:Carboxypeptidase regulatory-like domain